MSDGEMVVVWGVQYVAPHGDDLADGRTPWTRKRSIQAAVDVLPQYGCVSLPPGVYDCGTGLDLGTKYVVFNVELKNAYWVRARTVE